MAKTKLAKAKAKPRRKQSAVRKLRRRVFILGAGASASCGIAIARDILGEAMQRLARRNAGQADKVHDLLRYLYPGFSEDLSNFRSAFSSAAPAVSRCETLYRERYAAGCSLDYRIIYSSY